MRFIGLENIFKSVSLTIWFRCWFEIWICIYIEEEKKEESFKYSSANQP